MLVVEEDSLPEDAYLVSSSRKRYREPYKSRSSFTGAISGSSGIESLTPLISSKVVSSCLATATDIPTGPDFRKRNG